MADSNVNIVIKTVDKTSGEIKKVDSSFGGLGKTVAGLATAGALVAVGSQLAAFGKSSITAASDVEEMQSKFNTVFGNQSSSVTKQLQEFADSANRSIYDLQGFAATLQDTFVPLGFARDQAADMSVEIVKLSEDLASFNNLDTASVVQDMQSALVGNTEVLRKYGVVAQVAQQEQFALTNGIWDGVGAMTAQEKAAAILGITYASTTDAQGDAIKTADSFANSMKGVEAKVKDLQVQIGQQLLPVAGEMLSIFSETSEEVFPVLVELMQESVPAIQNAADELREFASVLDSEDIRRGADILKFLYKFTIPGFAGELRKLPGNIRENAEEFGYWGISVAETTEVMSELDDVIRGTFVEAMKQGTSGLEDFTEEFGFILPPTAAWKEQILLLNDAMANQLSPTITAVVGEIPPFDAAMADAEASTRALAEAYGVAFPQAAEDGGEGVDEAEGDIASLQEQLETAHAAAMNLYNAYVLFADLPDITKRVSIVGIGNTIGGIQTPDDVTAPAGTGGGSSSASGTAGQSGVQAPSDVGPDGTPGSTLPGGGDQIPNGPGAGGQGRTANGRNGTTNYNFFGPAATSPASIGSTSYATFPRG